MQKNLTELTQEELVALIQQERATAHQVITEMQNEITTAEAVAQAAVNTSAKVIVTVGRQTYSVTAPKFVFNGTEYQAEDLKENKKLAEELVKIGSGILVKV